jgi:AraC-like DNA-binding protein
MHSHDPYIKEKHLLMSSTDIAQSIGKSKSYVQTRCKAMDLHVPREVVRKFKQAKACLRTTFTAQDDAFLKENYLKIPVKRMAIILGHNSAPTFNRMMILKLEVPKEVALSRKLKTQFKKGQVPHNKGKNISEWMDPEKYERLKSNQFKKGSLPHNTLEDGVIKKREDKTGVSYLYIRIAKANWQLLQREVYRKEIGPLKPTDVVRFKNGNTLDCSPGNLEKITKAENMRRNSIHRHGPEVAKAQFLIKKIESKINHKNPQS